MQFDKSFTSHFVDPATKLPITGLTGVTITILQRNPDDSYTKVVDAEPCSEVSDGWYQYVFSAIQDKFYLYSIYPNDSQAYPESGFVDKRLNNLDDPISGVSGGGESTGGVGFYMSGGAGVDTEAIEKKFSDIMTEIKKEPEKYTKALQDTKNAIVDTVKKIPQPIVNVKASDVTLDIPPEFLQEIKTIVSNFNEGATGKLKATDDAYTLILKRFRENIATDIQNAVRNDQSSFDSVIESAILRATSEFTQALSNITLIEEE